MDPALIELYEDGSADDLVSVILRLGPGDPPPGVTIVARLGPIATCRLRRGDIPRVRAADQVLSMKAARFYGPALEPRDAAEAADDLEPAASDRRRPEGPLPTGAGVVIAHIDWGLDIGCRAFRNADGSTRLLALWDQAAPYDPTHPNRYGYGRIYERAEIDAALRTSDPYRTLGYAPWTAAPSGGSHGTHTTSISAGNGLDGGPEGIAPRADIVFVDLSTRTPDGPTPLGHSAAFLEGLDFCAHCAGDKPLVVNASLGRQAGPKDGLSLTEQGIDAFLLQAPGRAVVQSAGNYFERNAHTSRLLAPGGRCAIHMAMPAGRGEGEVDLWYRGTDRFGVELRGPAGVGVVSAGPDTRATVTFRGRTVGRLYHRIDDPNNHDNQIVLTLSADAPEGMWELRLTGDSVADGRFHAWIERVAPGARRRMQFVTDEVRRELTLGTICTSYWSLAVAAYDGHAPERPLAPFSSSGSSRDHRRLKPFIAAPGMGVLASRSRPRSGSAPHLIRMRGTSMAAPHVAGAVALMYAAAPRRLTIHEVRALLAATVDPVPEDATPAERLRLGAGYLNVSEAVAAAARIGPAAGAESGEAVTLESLVATEADPETAEAGAEDEGGEGDWTFSPVVELSDAEMDDIASLDDDAEGRSSYDRPARGWGPPPGPLPFQFQIPLGGGAPGIAVPLGGPFAFTVPLGGTPATPAAAPPATAAPAQTPAAPAAAPAAVRTDEPVAVAAPDPVALLGGAGEAWGERVVAPLARQAAAAGGFAHSAEVFAAVAGELAEGAPAPPLSATRLFGWLGTDGGDRLAQRIERLLPGGRLLILALPHALATDLELRPGDLLVRVARGQRFGSVAVVAGGDVVRAEQLIVRGWRGEGDPDPLPGRYVQVADPGSWARDDGRPLARRVATGAGLVPPDTMLLRLEAIESREPEADGIAGEGASRPILRQGSRGPSVREAQAELNQVHARNVQDGGAGLTDCPLAVDGIFGIRTQNAVRAFQHLAFPNQPREWDGIVGPHTWTALDAFLKREVRPPPPVVPAVVPLNPARWRSILDGVPGAPLTSQNAVHALIDGGATYPAMAADIRAAQGPRSFIYLLGWDCYDNFPLLPHDCATSLNRLLADAIARGVQVRAMIWRNLAKLATIRQVADRLNALAGPSGNAACIVDSRTGGATPVGQAAITQTRATIQSLLLPITLVLEATAEGRRLLAEIDADIDQMLRGLLAAHHQKVLVIFNGETLIGYCGGLDLNPNRADDTTNCLPGTLFEPIKPSDPQHDTHCRIIGPAAAELLRTFVDRWQDHPDHVAIDAAKSPLRGANVASVPAPAVPNPSPADAPSGASTSVAIARTSNAPAGGTIPRQREVRTLLQRAIANARRFIYIEDQYLWDFDTPSGGPIAMAAALNAALPRVRHITVVIPANRISDFWWAQRVWRSRFIAEVRRGHPPEVASRFRVFQLNSPPCSADGCLGTHSYVHSKCWVFDDELAVIGSANCNRRGYQHDSELDAFIFDDAGPAGTLPPAPLLGLATNFLPASAMRTGPTFAQHFRQALWQEHLGVAVADGADASAWPTGPVPVGRVVPFLPGRPLVGDPAVDALAMPVVERIAEVLRPFVDPVSP